METWAITFQVTLRQERLLEFAFVQSTFGTIHLELANILLNMHAFSCHR